MKLFITCMLYLIYMYILCIYDLFFELIVSDMLTFSNLTIVLVGLKPPSILFQQVLCIKDGGVSILFKLFL